MSGAHILKSVGNSTPPCGTPFLNWCCVDVLLLNVVYAFLPLMQSAMYLTIVCGMFVWCSICVSVRILTVSNALLMSSATVIVRSGGLPWLNPVAMGVVYVVKGCACRVVAFEAMLCGDVWGVVCDVWE